MLRCGEPADRWLTSMELQKEILGLAIAYALLAALLVIALRARIPWPLKVAMVLVTSVYYCVAFFRIEYLPGWSATAPPCCRGEARAHGRSISSTRALVSPIQ